MQWDSASGECPSVTLLLTAVVCRAVLRGFMPSPCRFTFFQAPHPHEPQGCGGTGDSHELHVPTLGCDVAPPQGWRWAPQQCEDPVGSQVGKRATSCCCTRRLEPVQWP